MTLTEDLRLFEDTPDLERRVRSRDPETSWRAAALLKSADSRDLKQAIYALLVEHGPMTDDELFQRYSAAGGRRTPQRVRTSRQEMCVEYRGHEITVRAVEGDRAIGQSEHGNASQRWEAIQ